MRLTKDNLKFSSLFYSGGTAKSQDIGGRNGCGLVFLHAMPKKSDLSKLLLKRCGCLKRDCYQQFASRKQKVEEKQKEFSSLPRSEKDFLV